MNLYKKLGFLIIQSYCLFGNAQIKTLEDIRVRDPFIIAHKVSKQYYLYAQTGNRLNEKDSINGVEVYISKDLKIWEGPKTVFSAPKDHWGNRMVWAPEVHEYKGKYYLFVTFTGNAMVAKPNNKPEQYQRGTQILVSSSPEGPFEPYYNQATTPLEWMSLDGTLWVENGTPYMIFCHEWAQIYDGTVELIQLMDDLSKTVGKPKTLFKATDSSWVKSLASTGYQYEGYVTDGCFLYKTKQGKLIMIWSSFGDKGYALGQLISQSNSIHGPWKQIDQLLFEENGGHGMIFKTFDNILMITLHQPNSGKNERAKIYELEDMGDYLRLGNLKN